MAVTCELRYDDGDQSSERATDIYVIQGTSDKATAYASLGSTSPGTKYSMSRDDIEVSYLGPAEWLGRASYKTAESEPQEGDRLYSFSTVGGTEHITHSLIDSTPTTFVPAGKTAPDFKGAINARIDGDKIEVEGMSKEFAVYEWEETYVHSNSDIDAAYIATLYALSWKLNDASFTDAVGNSFSAGEVLFRGATGRRRGGGSWELVYKFAARPNLTGKTVGAIVNIAKDGWQYLWVLYERKYDSGSKRSVKQPIAVYVHDVHEAADFSGLKLT